MNNLQTVTDDLLTLLMLMKDRFIKPTEHVTRAHLSPVQMQVMTTLLRKGHLSMSALAREMRISKQQLTPLICRLIDNSMVVRKPDEHDRRRVQIELTPQGRNTFAMLRTAIGTQISTRLRALSDADLEELDTALKRIHGILSKVE